MIRIISNASVISDTSCNRSPATASDCNINITSTCDSSINSVIRSVSDITNKVIFIIVVVIVVVSIGFKNYMNIYLHNYVGVNRDTDFYVGLHYM